MAIPDSIFAMQANCLTHQLVAVVALLVSCELGCVAFSREMVEQERFSVLEAPVATLAVLPFYPDVRLSRSHSPEDASGWEAAGLVTRFVTEAVARMGIVVIPESDVQLAFASQGQVTPRADPHTAAVLAAERFGAGGILLGVVDRYRERKGSAYGSFESASIEFEVTLYEAPTGRKIWSGRFNQTQPSLTSNLFTAARYPGGGFRFLTVAELARWGAQLIAEKLPIVPARSD